MAIYCKRCGKEDGQLMDIVPMPETLKVTGPTQNNPTAFTMDMQSQFRCKNCKKSDMIINEYVTATFKFDDKKDMEEFKECLDEVVEEMKEDE